VKKIVSILLILIYLPAVSGVTVDSFYCCGNLASVNFQLGSDEAASNTSNPSESSKVNLGCCNHVIHSFRIQNQQQQTSFRISFNASNLSPVLIPFCVRKLNNAEYEIHTGDYDYLKSPPPLLGNLPLFIRNESFLI